MADDSAPYRWGTMKVVTDMVEMKIQWVRRFHQEQHGQGNDEVGLVPDVPQAVGHGDSRLAGLAGLGRVAELANTHLQQRR